VTDLALLLVFVSAFAHATWNYLAKASRDGYAFAWAFSAIAALLYLPVALVVARAQPPPPSTIYLVGVSAIIHVFYFRLLMASYARADLSVAYPVARGTSLLLVPVGSALILGESVSPSGAAAIALIFVGVLAMHARGSGRAAAVGLVRSLREPGSPLAALTGVSIAAYSLWDKNAVSQVNPIIYDTGIFFGESMVLAPLMLGWCRSAVLRELSERPGRVVAAAVLAPLAYLLVLQALTFSRVAYVSPAREIGIVVGILLGTRNLKEPYPANRLFGAGLIVVGVFALALSP
jgi:drug/metabolite transporter (DMT)-like permease